MTGDNCFKINLADALTRLPGPQNENVVTVLERGSLVAKLYAPRGNDPQTPHSKDEVYVVAKGSGEFVCGGRRQSFEPRDVLFVAAGVEHHFEKFTEEFAVWVFFYGPEGGEADQA
ncbi:MAG TPA: cupin domain-containing protein [Pyrinomonadaceae bacterium]|nr:cupin domain-containing protein [Pyrinomonadaceae bacterium]